MANKEYFDSPSAKIFLRATLTVGGLAVVTLIIVLSVLNISPATKNQDSMSVNVSEAIQALILDEDTDGDKKITIDDPRVPGTARGDKHFWTETTAGRRMEISGTYYLSNLLQDLKLAEEQGQPKLTLDPTTIFEPPADRISRMIRALYWQGLTRRIDEQGIATVLSDEKARSSDGFRYVYVPASDSLALSYFSLVSRKYPDIKMKAAALPERIDASYVRRLDGRHGLLTLKMKTSKSGQTDGVPFVVPGGRFNEMYGWDSYFIVLGLLEDGNIDLAKAIVDNFVYEVEHYGKILNANRTYFLTRSQPPFLSSMVRAVYDKLPKNESSKSWLGKALAAVINEYRNIWMSKDHLTTTGLSRYFDTGSGPAPEVEPGHYDAVYADFAKRVRMSPKEFERLFTSGRIRSAELGEYFIHDRAMRESGHDTSYRLEGRCANLATVDLNALLYKIEKDAALLIRREFKGNFILPDGEVLSSSDWSDRAAKRLELLNRYLWNEERGMYFDYDVVNGGQTDYVSATTFYPIWAGAASGHQGERIVEKALGLLEEPGGIASTTKESRGPITSERPQRQWDYPYGWAPHQMIAWQGLTDYGYESIAHRLMYKWLYTIVSNATNYNGTIAEKYDVVKRSHEVFAEYGNVGTKFSYITREGFGWTNASYQVGLSILPQELRTKLNELIPPEWVFEGYKEQPEENRTLLH